MKTNDSEIISMIETKLNEPAADSYHYADCPAGSDALSDCECFDDVKEIRNDFREDEAKYQ